jgi:site-specific DNA-cytosine methylase
MTSGITIIWIDGWRKFPLNKLMLDIFSGLEGASQAQKERGWEVITVDNDPLFNPTVVADVNNWSWYGRRPDFAWFSPPCDEFAREFMPWIRTGRPPDLSLLFASMRIIKECRPRYWIIENVRGAIRWFRPFLGDPRAIVGPFFLWGYYPDIGKPKIKKRKKESMSSSWRAERAKIPYELSLAFALAIERQPELLEVTVEKTH